MSEEPAERALRLLHEDEALLEVCAMNEFEHERAIPLWADVPALWTALPAAERDSFRHSVLAAQAELAGLPAELRDAAQSFELNETLSRNDALSDEIFRTIFGDDRAPEAWRSE